MYAKQRTATAADHVVASVVTAGRAGQALLHLLSPTFLLSRRLNPHRRTRAFAHRRHALAFRADMVAQNVLDRSFLRQLWLRALDHELEDRAPRPVGEVEEVAADHPDLATIVGRSRREQRPLVIRGFVRDATTTGDWAFERFLDRYGHEPVVLSCPARDGYEGLLSEVNVPGVYLHNSELLLRRHPELLTQAGVHRLERTLARDLGFSGVAQLFVGRRDTGTWWHCAPAFNFFVMLDGAKRWTFIDPAESPLLLPRTRGPGRSTFYLSDHGAASAVFQKYRSLLGEAEPADHDQSHSLGARAFAHTNRTATVLRAGDVLMNPPYWWHDVENLGESSIGMATRWLDPSPTVGANPLFEVAGRLNLPFLYRHILARIAQRRTPVSDIPAEPDTDRGVSTYASRALGLGQFGHVADDVHAYYRRQSTGGSSSRS